MCSISGGLKPMLCLYSHCPGRAVSLCILSTILSFYPNVTAIPTGYLTEKGIGRPRNSDGSTSSGQPTTSSRATE
jgi:hypothetical protein